MPASITLAELLAAQRRLAGYAVHTPLLNAPALDAAVGAKVWVKAESLQRGGAFKARGAYNAIAALGPEGRARGVLAFSSGNHAIAVAQAAAAFHVPATIVMPADAPAAKRETAAAAGAELVLYDRLTESREAIAAALAQERSLPVVPPFDDPFVMAGQGTAGLEIAADLGARGERIDLALICASGGGLASGVGVALKAFDPAIDVVVVEPDGHDDIARSLSSGAIVRNAPGVRSICDGLLVEQMGAHPFATLRALEARTVTVTDAEVRRAMRLAFETLKLVLEPSGAAALAAALAGKADVAGRNVVVLASGGNVDPAVFAAVLQH